MASNGFEKSSLPGCTKGQNHIGVTMNEYKGRMALDVREYYCANDGDELWHASPRGVRIPLHGARKFLEAVQKAVNENASMIDAAEVAAKPAAKTPKPKDSKKK